MVIVYFKCSSALTCQNLYLPRREWGLVTAARLGASSHCGAHTTRVLPVSTAHDYLFRSWALLSVHRALLIVHTQSEASAGLVMSVPATHDYLFQFRL